MQRVALGPTETLRFTAPRLFSDSDDVFVRRIYSWTRWLYLTFGWQVLWALSRIPGLGPYFSMTPLYTDAVVHNVHSTPFAALVVYPEVYLGEMANHTRTSLVAACHGEDHSHQISLRTMLNAQCDGSPLCKSCNATTGLWMPSPVGTSVEVALSQKSQSVFCLEPSGDWPTRQSIVQDVLLGCIPVFFAEEQLLLWPAHFDPLEVGVWMEPSPLLLDKRKNIVDILRRIPPHIVAHKQVRPHKYTHIT